MAAVEKQRQDLLNTVVHFQVS